MGETWGDSELLICKRDMTVFKTFLERTNFIFHYKSLWLKSDWNKTFFELNWIGNEVKNFPNILVSDVNLRKSSRLG